MNQSKLRSISDQLLKPIGEEHQIVGPMLLQEDLEAEITDLRTGDSCQINNTIWQHVFQGSDIHYAQDGLRIQARLQPFGGGDIAVTNIQ